MKKNIKKISVRILTSILLGVVAVLSISAGINYVLTKKMVKSLSAELTIKTLELRYTKLESTLTPIFNSADKFKKLLTDQSLSEQEIILHNAALKNKLPAIFSSKVHIAKNNLLNEYTLIDDSCKSTSLYFDTIFTRDNNKRQVDIREDTILLCTPFYNEEEVGFIEFSFALDTFVNQLNSEPGLFQSNHYLFDANGQQIISKTRPYRRDSLEQIVESKCLQKYILKKKIGFIQNPELKYRVLFIHYVEPIKLYIASALKTDVVLRRFKWFYAGSFSISILTIVILMYLLRNMVISITRPLEELSGLSKQIEKGGLHIEIPEYSKDSETIQISNTLRTVQGRMQRYVSGFNATLKEKRFLEHEISLAGKIQLDMLPLPDRALTHIPEVDVYAKMVPSNGIAGDFYDYFFIDEHRLFFVLGDVSGHGIASALFMVKTITLIEVEARKGQSPAEIFRRVNQDLTQRNEEAMFTTAICGIINIKTGHLKLCDAGHNSPLNNIGKTSYDYFELKKNIPLGILINAQYKETEYALNDGDAIILYTDGFPEAENSKGDMLGNDVLKNCLLDKGSTDIGILSNLIWNCYNDFTGNMNPTDDVSLFILRYFGDR